MAVCLSDPMSNDLFNYGCFNFSRFERITATIEILKDFKNWCDGMEECEVDCNWKYI